ncbi:lipopolysaccharide biosynthesis protein [Aureimonas endophytica]|uniref:Lipopolysaccharide biosynthesis protein n=1 Tax=Aureimonas endophytica TaxID=2027858 RepID=A0A917E1T8_9HYPH|nr:oligosaccharide flippase family protein [Aureimonas endophytica]GGD95815.1 lipopolysaccharide biosynthesis protein [Aureimonas endophytica]
MPQAGIAAVAAEAAAEPSVASRTALAAIWVIGGKMLVRGIDFICLLLLARLLTPADFGLVAMAMTVLFVVEAVLELPLAQALLRVPKPTEAMFATVFTLGVLRAVAVAVLMGLAAWPMARFYEEPRLVPLICALSLAPVLRGLISPRMVIFMQSFDFRREAAIEIAGKSANLFIAVPLAFATQSYWALAVGTVTTPFVMTVLSYCLAPMRPRLTLQEWARFKDIVGWSSAAQFISAINWQFDRIVLGRLIDIVSFGRYAMANTLNDLPGQALVAPLTRPLLAAFAPAAQKGTLIQAHNRTVGTLALVTTPIFICLAFLAKPIVHIAVGTKWLEAAPILYWIALAQLISLPTVALYPLAMTLDRMRLVTFRMLVEFCMMVPAVAVLAYSFGVAGAIGARFLAVSASLVFCLTAVRGMIGLSIAGQLANLRRPYLAAVPMAAALWFFERALSPDSSLLDAVLHLLGGGLIGGVTYLAALLLLWRLEGSPPGLEELGLRRLRSLTARFA